MPLVLHAHDLFARIGGAITFQRIGVKFFAEELVAQLDRHGIEIDDVIHQRDLRVNLVDRCGWLCPASPFFE